MAEASLQVVAFFHLDMRNQIKATFSGLLRHDSRDYSETSLRETLLNAVFRKTGEPEFIAGPHSFKMTLPNLNTLETNAHEQTLDADEAKILKFIEERKRYPEVIFRKVYPSARLRRFVWSKS